MISVIETSPRSVFQFSSALINSLKDAKFAQKIWAVTLRHKFKSASKTRKQQNWALGMG